MIAFEYEILAVMAYRFAAFFAAVGELAVVAGHAVGFVIFQNVALAAQRHIALLATEVTLVETLIHGFDVFP